MTKKLLRGERRARFVSYDRTFASDYGCPVCAYALDHIGGMRFVCVTPNCKNSKRVLSAKELGS